MSLPCLYASTSGRREGQEKGKGEEKEEEEEGRGRRRKRGGAGEGKGGGAGEGLRDEPPYIVVGYLNFITFSTYFLSLSKIFDFTFRS